MKRFACFCILVFVFALTACSGPEARRDEFYKSSLELFEQQRYPEAKVQARNVLKVDKKFPKGYVLLGKINYELKLWRDSLNNFSRALEMEPTNLDALLGQARIYLLVGDLDRAGEQADKVLANSATNAEGQLVKAAVIARKGDRDQAMQMVETLIEMHPNHEEAYAFLSLMAFQGGDLDQSIAYLEKGLFRTPTSDGLNKQLGSMYARAGRFDDAEKIYLKLISLNPDDFDLQRMLIRFYFESDAGEKASKMASDLVASNPDDEIYALIQAEVLGRLGDVEAQDAALKKGVASFTPGYDLRLALIGRYLVDGRLEEARELARETADIEPDNEKALAARRMLADILVREVKYEEAEAELNKIFEYSPGDMEAQVFMGRVALAKGDPLKAISLFRQVIDEQPDLMAVYGHLSQAHYINGELKLAKAVLSDALRIKPEFDPARTALINLYLADNEYDRALGELRAVAQAQPENLMPIAYMGDIFLMQKKYDQAAQRYRRLNKMKGGSPLALYKLGKLEVDRKQYDKALDYFGKLLQGAPQAFQAAESIVGVYLTQKKYDQALAFCNKLLEKGPHPGAYDLMGRVEAARGNLEKAEEYFFKAKEVEPRWRDPYQMVGAIYLQAGKVDVAIEKFERALKESPEVVGNAYVLGMLYHDRGDFDRAAEMYEYVIERDRNFLPAVNNLAYLYADTATDKDKLNRALALALRAAGRSSSATLDTLGWVYFKTGNNEMALSTLFRAQDMNNEDPTILFHLATVHAAMGSNDQARMLAEKVAALDEDVPEKEQAQELLKTL